MRLTREEYGVLAELARFPSRMVTHAHLLRAVWGEGYRDDVECLCVATRGLRVKLEADPANPASPRNEPIVGYRFAPADLSPATHSPGWEMGLR